MSEGLYSVIVGCGGWNEDDYEDELVLAIGDVLLSWINDQSQQWMMSLVTYVIAKTIFFFHFNDQRHDHSEGTFWAGASMFH